MNLPPLLRILLWPLSQVYGIYVRCRYRLYTHGWLKPKRVNATVISVGNLTVGGNGTTPMALWLGQKYLTAGHVIGIVHPGYGVREWSIEQTWLVRYALCQNRP